MAEAPVDILRIVSILQEASMRVARKWPVLLMSLLQMDWVRNFHVYLRRHRLRTMDLEFAGPTDDIWLVNGWQ